MDSNKNENDITKATDITAETAPTEQTATTEKSDEIVEYKPTLLEKFRSWYAKNSKRNTLVLMLVIILVLVMVPYSRYSLAGMVVKKPVKVTVIDEKFNVPVSDAQVVLGAQTVTTNADGVAIFDRIPAGYSPIEITKPYYGELKDRITTPIKGQYAIKITLSPEGKQAPVIVIDKNTRQPVAGARLTAAGTYVTTDGKGEAYITVGENGAVSALITASGYKDKQVSLTLSPYAFSENTYELELK